ncbi:hypothetical protein [Providencia burhodogranariea]|uniref:Uncharacterized protein n=1 Tax=Providencia burhodogranariea DSM 19968 TaxID=1141662 RepID=K8W7C7_9GAMM|nr:hypothetical protein OOA_18609 [Providencia burhodogranariea DSM 19968]
MTKPIKHLQMFKLEDMNVQQDLGPNFDPLEPRPPSFTIHVAPRGSQIYDEQGNITDKTSDFGHTYMTVSGLNPATGKYEQTSIGLSPREDWGSSKDNLSFNDHIRYKDASTLTILSNSERFRNDLNNLFNVVNDYRSGKTLPPNYNPFSLTGEKTCGKFIQAVLKKAGIQGVQIPLLPDDAYEDLQELADDYRTPLVIDLNGNGVQTLADSFGVSFDFEEKGTKSQTGWVHPDDGLLVWDKNKDGLINHGEELFGDDSLLSNNIKAKDGFSALSEFDSNADGIIDRSDSQWSELKVWQDKNSDGISQSHELTTLEKLGTKSIELNVKETNFYDDNGNFHKLMAKVNWDDGKQTDITDVLFHQKMPSIQMPSIQQTVDKMIDDIVSFTQLSNGNTALIAHLATEYSYTASLATNYLR